MKVFEHIYNSRFTIFIWEKRLYVLVGLAGVSILVLGSGLFVMYSRYQYLATQVITTSSLSDKEADVLLTKVNSLISLPQGEKPTIATISDTQKLHDQPFFTQAKLGDKVIIYNTAKKVILYRPSSNKIINIAPLGVGNTQVAGASTQNTVQQSPIKIAVYNGTSVPKLAAKVSQRLQETIGRDVIKQDNASSQDYKNTIIISVTKIDQKLVKQIADTLSAKIVDLPATETAPEGVDVLVIAGTDAQGE